MSVPRPPVRPLPSQPPPVPKAGVVGDLMGLLLLLDLLVVGPAVSLLWGAVLARTVPLPWNLAVAAAALTVFPLLLAWRLTRGLARARVVAGGRRLLALLVCLGIHALGVWAWMRLERVDAPELESHAQPLLDQVRALAAGDWEGASGLLRSAPAVSPSSPLGAVGTGDGGTSTLEGKPPQVAPAPDGGAPRAAPDAGTTSSMEWKHDDVDRALLKPGFGYPPRARPQAPREVPAVTCPKGARLVRAVTVQDGGAWAYCALPNGFMHGSSTQWFVGGAVKELAQFRDGLKQGVLQRFDSDGKLLLRGSFEKDQKEGMFEEWWDVDPPDAEANALPRMHGTASGKYVHGRKEGAWTGIMERCLAQPPDLLCIHVKQVQNYKAGIPEGAVEEWYENGQRALQGTYRAGRPHGAWTYFHADGTVSWRQTFANGHRSGTWQRYCPNGRLVLRENYDAQGRRHGAYESWYPDGARLQRGRFHEGRMDDQWETRSGPDVEQATYSRGVANKGRISVIPPTCTPPDKTALALRHRVSRDDE